MGELIRRMDWATSPLGEPEDWSESLKASVSTCLNSGLPMVIWWGKEMVKIYNDAYLSILGARQAAPMGAGWWADISPKTDSLLQQVFQTGKPTSAYQQLECTPGSIPKTGACYTHSYSAIWTKTGTVGGVFGTISQTPIREINQDHVAR